MRTKSRAPATNKTGVIPKIGVRIREMMVCQVLARCLTWKEKSTPAKLRPHCVRVLGQVKWGVTWKVEGGEGPGAQSPQGCPCWVARGQLRLLLMFSWGF